MNFLILFRILRAFDSTFFNFNFGLYVIITKEILYYYDVSDVLLQKIIYFYLHCINFIEDGVIFNEFWELKNVLFY